MTCAHHGMLEKDPGEQDSMPKKLHACVEYMVYWVDDSLYAEDCDAWEPDGSVE